MKKTSDKLKKIVLSNIKHDLTNPINAILGYSELLLDIIDMDLSMLKNDIKSIHDSGNSILSDIKKIFSNEALENLNIADIISNSELQYSLRIPLTTIVGLTELIIEDKLYESSSECNDIEDSLNKISQAGKILLKLIKDLKKSSNYSINELMDHYQEGDTSEKSSLYDFDINMKHKIQDQIGTILLVDDEISNIELLQKILEQSKHKVYSALNASKALNILSDNSKTIDLILLDLIMPGMNGMELLQKLKKDENTNHIPAIMLSALDEIDTIVECINLGAEDFLVKPVNRVLLRARLNNALEKKHLRDKELRYQKEIKKEQQKSETLLLNILPGSIAERLKDGETPIADDIDNATVLFADLKEFTTLSSEMNAQDLVMLLNDVFSVFDGLLTKHSLEKIKTIGDNYMLAGGIPKPTKNHAEHVAEMALDMLDIMPKINIETHNSMQIRIGINSGPVSAGVIGNKKFIYDLWGDTVNVASRMESFGINNHIQVSETTYQLLKELYEFEKRNKIDIPGKGKMQTYLLTGRL